MYYILLKGMNIIQLYSDYGIDFRTEGHKHCREGWVNIACPFCMGNTGYHLGFHLENEYFVCWRCGSHPVKAVLSEILRVNFRELQKILVLYESPGKHIKRSEKPPVPFRYPSDILEQLPKTHQKYLIGRKFDPDFIKQEYDIKATGMLSTLDGLDYKWRIIIPIDWNGKTVSFTARSISQKVEQRYMACPGNREIINLKTIVYGKPKYWNDLAVVVEGPTDQWRFGNNSVATFGIKYKPAQVRVLSKNFKRIIVLYDDDPQAIIQSKKLVADLNFCGSDAFSYFISGDPGSMKQDDANHLMKELQTYKIK